MRRYVPSGRFAGPTLNPLRFLASGSLLEAPSRVRMGAIVEIFSTVCMGDCTVALEELISQRRRGKKKSGDLRTEHPLVYLL